MRTSFLSGSAALALGLAGSLITTPGSAQTTRTIYTAGALIGQVDIAYAPDVQRHLCVWRERITPGTIRGLFLDPDGAVIGAPFDIGTFSRGPGFINTIEVAYVARRQRFVVVWGTTGAALAKSVHAVTADVSPLPTSLNIFAGRYGLGGDLTRTHDHAVLAARDNDGMVVALKLALDSGGMVRVADDLLISTIGASPRIAQTGGTTGRHCVVWRDFASHEFRCVVVEPDFSLSDQVRLASDSAIRYAVDGDGINWMATYQEAGSWQCASIGYDPLNAVPFVRGDPVVPPGPPEFERTVDFTDLGWLGDSVLFLRSDIPPRVDSIDPLGCTACQSAWTLSGCFVMPRMATTYDGRPSPTQSQAVVVGIGTGFPTGPDWLEAATIYAKDGTTTPLGGACGPGVGTPYAPCMIGGRAAYPLRLHGAMPFKPVVVMISPRQEWSACGPCVLVPEMASTSFFAGYTDERGEATAIVPPTHLPSTVGMPFYAQWLVLGSSSCLGGGLSSAQEIWIE